MRGMKRILKMGCALVLSVTMILSPLPLESRNTRQVQAVEMPVRYQSSLRLGTSIGEGRIIGGSNNAVSIDNNTIDHVYYGKFNGQPLRCRVLCNGVGTKIYNAPGDDSSKILLHSETIVNSGYYANSTSNEWKDSSAKAWLNGSSFLLNTNNFTSIEEGAIAQSYRNSFEATSHNGVKSYDDSLNGEKVFVLSWSEANYSDYTFGENKTRIRKYGQNAYSWWLRTRQETTGYVWYVDSQGEKNCKDKGYTAGYCPAFVVNPNDILFSYMVTDYDQYNKSNYYGKDYTFTLRDTDIGISAPYGAEIDSTGKTLTLKYDVTGSHKGNVNRLSALVLDKEYSRNNFSSTSIKDYRPLTITEGNITSGTAKVTLNDNYSDTSKYYIYLVAEDINGIFETDYAGDPVRITAFHQWNLSENKDGSVKATCSKHSNESYTARISVSGKIYDGTKVATGKVVKDSGFPSIITAGSIYYKGTGTTSYSASTTPPTDAGTYQAYAVFKGASGEKTAKTAFTIEQKNLENNMVVLTQGSYEYDGNLKMPTIKVKDGSRELRKDTDYSINTSSVLSAKGIGSYEIKVDGCGNYKGSASAAWSINKHEHSLSRTAAKAATETAPGNSEYYYCSKCGKYYSDAQGKNEIDKDSWIIPAKGNGSSNNSGSGAGNSSGNNNNNSGTNGEGNNSGTGNNANAGGNSGTNTGNAENTGNGGNNNSGNNGGTVNNSGSGNTATNSGTGTSTGNNANTGGNSSTNTGSNGGNNSNTGNTNAPAPAKVGKPLTDPVTKANVTVVSADRKNPTVAYKKNSSGNAKTVTIPATVKIGGVKYKVVEISKGAFKGKTKITKVTIGKNITKIGAEAFYGCINLKTVSGGAAVKSVGAKAFYNCKKLTKAPLGAKVTSIGDRAFYNCSSLNSFTIPVNVTKLGKEFLGKTPKLRTLTVKSRKLVKKNIKAKAFTGMGSKKTVTKVPKGMTKTYKILFQGKGMNKSIKVQ